MWTLKLPVFANLPFNDIWKLSNKIIYSRTLSLLYCSTYGTKISLPYKPAFRPGLLAFSAFVTKHNSLARETAYLLSPTKKDAFLKLTKKNCTHCKTFSRHFPRFKNHLKLLRTFEQKIEKPQQGTFYFAAILVYLHYRAVRTLNTRNR